MRDSLTFSKFQAGMDRRYIENDRDPNGFWDLHNCYVSARNRIEKRPGIHEDVAMTADTVGLFPFNGRLWTLFAPGTGTPTTQPQPPHGPELWVIDLKHDHVGDIIRQHFAGVLLGGVYLAVEYDELVPPPVPPRPEASPTNVVQHFYVVTDAEIWQPNNTFNSQDPEGIRTIPTTAIDDVNKIIDMSVFYEAQALGKAKGGPLPEPTWPVNGATEVENEIIWTGVELLDRDDAVIEAISYNPDGILCIPQSRRFVAEANWRAWRATNIGEGETLLSGDDPVWDTLIGSTTIDGDILWECVLCRNWAANREYDIDWPLDDDGIYDTSADYGHAITSDIPNDYLQIFVGRRGVVSTGPVEPVWNTSIDGLTQDGSITWRTKSTKIIDPNCPRSKEVLVMQSKVYATGSHLEIATSDTDLHMDSIEEADIVRYCATNDPFDWSAEQDAGFIASGVQASGSEVARALGRYNDKLVVLMSDNIQLWAVDPDPQLNALIQVIGDIGTTISESVMNIGTDLLFLSNKGFRSLGQQQDELIVHDTDVGTPVDDPVVEAIQRRGAANFDHITSTLFPEHGQYWCAIDTEIWVWTWSRNTKVNAWSRYTAPVHIDYFALINDELFARAIDNTLLHVDTDTVADYTGEIPVTIEFSFQSVKGLGVMKQFQGADVVLSGEAEVSYKFDAAEPDRETPRVTMKGNTRSGQLMPVEVMATEIAPILRYTGLNKLQLDALTLYFNKLGPV